MFICIKVDLTLNNLQCFIWNKVKADQSLSYVIQQLLYHEQDVRKDKGTELQFYMLRY